MYPSDERWRPIVPTEGMWHLISLVCNGVPERFPDLEFVFQEPGFEWVPWMMWRLDDHYLQNSQDLPMLTKRPSEYIRDQFYFTTQPLGHTENHQHMGWAMEISRLLRKPPSGHNRRTGRRDGYLTTVHVESPPPR